ncbi:MAG: hypothetical protein DBX55_05395 [Verrucomicrobia bacterium]|nr:MAG: hypothetical protein DBX55_05395 [Verrucomicrobiota bacterium]
MSFESARAAKGVRRGDFCGVFRGRLACRFYIIGACVRKAANCAKDCPGGRLWTLKGAEQSGRARREGVR